MISDGEDLENLKFEQKILKAESQIAKAISGLFNLEEILDNICREIQSLLGFDFVTISLVVPTKNTIETVHGIGVGQDWADQARHYLEEDRNLRDIQADIIKTRQTEIISGWDKRFDRWLYDTFGHEQFTRIFTPIILVQDESGKVSKDWFEHYDWISNFIPENGDGGERHTVIKMQPLSNFVYKPIGTVEAGYNSCERQIEHSQAIELAHLTARRALDIHQAQLRYVLEVIAENARKILEADLITLHFLWDTHQNRYIYEANSGKVKQLLLNEFPPRREGLGWQAIRSRKPQFASSDLESFNPTAYKEGSRSYAAFPLLIERNKQEVINQTIVTTAVSEIDANQEQFESAVGVLYVHFQYEYQFVEEEVKRGEFFAERTVDAIWQAITYQQVHDKARQLSTLHSVSQFLRQIPEKGDLLSHIAWSTLNVLAADVITIYAYLQAERQFLTPPSIAGRLKAEQEMKTEIHSENVPFLLIDRGKNLYVSDLLKEATFRDSLFAKREGIKSVAAIVLKVDEDIVGVMFINYRRPHSFSKEECQIIDMLASSASTAIKNQRWLQTLSDIDHEIITTLNHEELLNLIVQRSVGITGADLGVIRRLEPISQELVAQAKYPPSELVKEAWNRMRLDEGVTGWVAKHRKPDLVKDVQTDPRYIPYFANTISEICVPLLDKDGRVIGVLNVESRKKIFTGKEVQRLEVLADLAVIAIENAESKKKLSSMEMLATLGDITSQLSHRMNNDVGALKILLRELTSNLNTGNVEFARNRAANAINLIERVCRNLGKLKSWKQEEPKQINLHQAVHEALDQVQINHGIRFRMELPPSLPEVLGGEQQLIGVFDNLIQNAIDAMANGGMLSISGKSVEQETQPWIEIIVCDMGLGIARENLTKIFQAGFTTKTERGSLGVGLWWTQRQIESLGGQLLVESTLGQGTKFTVILPAYQSGAKP